MEKDQLSEDIPFSGNESFESKVIQLFGTVTPRNRPEDFQQVREEFERGIAEEVLSELKEVNNDERNKC